MNRQILRLLLLILIWPKPLLSQLPGNASIVLFPGTPTGNCNSRQLALDESNGSLYTCTGAAGGTNRGTWQIIAGGGGGGGGWNPPGNIPGNTIFGNNAVGTGSPSFFTPGGDVSFSAGNFSVNSLHFGPNSLALTNTGIATGNCLQVSGSSIIGGACGTGGGGGAVTSVFGRSGAIVAQANDYTYAQVAGAAPLDSPDFTGIPTAITAPLGTNTTQLATTAFVIANAGTSGTSYPGLSSNGTTLTFSGPGGITASQFNSTGTGGFRIDSVTAALPASPPASGHSSLVSGPDGWYIADNGGGFNRILSGTGGGTSGVASFNGRTGAVVPQASDYSAFFAPIGTTGNLVSSVFGRTGAVVGAPGDYSVGDVTGAASLQSPAFTGSPSAPTPPATDNSTRIATTQWVIANAAGAGGGGQPLPITPSPQQPSVCAAQNVQTANALTLSGLNIAANDTVIVPIVTNVNNTTATVTDNSGSASNYSTLFTRYQTTGNTSIIVTTPASAAHAATSLTITISGNTKFVACVLAYENVTAFGVPAGFGIGSAVANGTVSATTHDNNNIVLGMFGQSVATSMSITTGTPLNIGSSGVPYYATSATAAALIGLCANNEPVSGSFSTCVATFATSASYTGIAVELRSGAVSSGGFAGPKVVAFHKANVIATTTAATDTAFMTCSATDCPAGYYRITWDFLSLGSGCTNGTVIVNVDYFDEYDLVNPYHTGIGSATAIGPGRNHAYWVRMMTVAKLFSSTVGIRLTTSTTACSAGTGTAQQTVSIERLQ